MIIYQLLPRLFGNTNAQLIPYGSLQQNGCGKLNDITTKALRSIKALGVTHVWYTGLLEHATQTDYSASGISHDHHAMVKGKAGSPYAVKDYYDLDPDLASHPDLRWEEFKKLVKRTHNVGLKVVMDFIPNHVARQYHSDHQPKDILPLGANDDPTQAFRSDNNFYYLPGQPLNCTFNMQADEPQPYTEFPAKATGNDCFTASPQQGDWYETIKLNYGVDYLSGHRQCFSPTPDTWEKMLHILLFWARQGVDAFRCDMAEMVPCEFWEWAVPQVKNEFPELLFIGEVYNPALYRDYIHQGHFDLLYDKVGLYDTLRRVTCGHAPATAITDCWKAIEDIRSHMLNFLENHDEQRLASDFYAGQGERGFAPLLVSACMNRQPFMLYFGQELGERGMDAEGFSGRDGRTSIFDYWSIETIRQWNDKGRWGNVGLSKESLKIRRFYQDVLGKICKEKAVSEGRFFDLMYANLDNPDCHTEKVFAFIRSCETEHIFFIINFDHQPLQQKITIPAHAFDFLGLQEGFHHATNLLTRKILEIALFHGQKIHVEIPAHSGVVLKLQD